MTLCLFSSNIRPQYEQDIVDVAASPAGHVFRFRYESKYIDDAVEDDWLSNKLVGTDVLLIYSIQQPQNYHPPEFVPIRSGKVVRSSQDGSVFFVDFKLGDYSPLREPKAGETRGTVVAEFTAALGAALPGSPGAAEGKRYSAASGSVPAGFLAIGDPSTAFERLASYLAGTVSFAAHLFWRVSELRELGGDAVAADDQGRFRLYSNRTYELTVVHYQPDVSARPFGMTTGEFDVQTDTSIVEVIGDKSIEIASRYDAVPIRLRVPASTDVRETVLAIRPSTGTKGPQADIRLLVGPGDGKRLLGGGAAASAVVLATIPGMMNKTASFGDKVWFPIAAGLITLVIGYFALPIRK
ncbi:MAG: hypothetical protein ACRDQ2_18450 [Gaiellales bacterium]